MNWKKPSHLTSLLGVLLSTTAAVTGADAQSFGRVGAVNQEATGTPPGGAMRKLTVGTNIVVKERVRTSRSGSTQIQFPDQSAINLGANCDLVIDEVVYDPQSKTGTMVASVSRGAMRYIGGQISHNSGATIRTPSAQLGIRGALVTVVVQIPANIAALLPPGLQTGTLVIASFGQTTLQNNAGTATLPPGFATVIGGAHDVIPTPDRLPHEVLKLIADLINGGPNSTGGVANKPTSNDVPPGYTVTVLPDPTNPPGTDPLGYLGIFATGNSAAKGVSQAGQAGSVSPPAPAAPPCECQ